MGQLDEYRWLAAAAQAAQEVLEEYAQEDQSAEACRYPGYLQLARRDKCGQPVLLCSRCGHTSEPCVPASILKTKVETGSRLLQWNNAQAHEIARSLRERR